MTTEEYIKQSVLPVAKQEDDILSVSNVNIAIDMARHEQRDKAAEAFSKILSSIGFLHLNGKNH